MAHQLGKDEAGRGGAQQQALGAGAEFDRVMFAHADLLGDRFGDAHRQAVPPFLNRGIHAVSTMSIHGLRGSSRRGGVSRYRL